MIGEFAVGEFDLDGIGFSFVCGGVLFANWGGWDESEWKFLGIGAVGVDAVGDEFGGLVFIVILRVEFKCIGDVVYIEYCFVPKVFLNVTVLFFEVFTDGIA